MEVIFQFAYFILLFHQILFWVWLWQLKEYRFDRFKASFSWKLLIQQFDLRTWWRPKPTSRAALAVLVVSCWWLVTSNIFNLFLAPVLVAIALGFISPIFILWKQILIWKAKEKMKSFKGTVIGVTGSYGKSMTKEMLTQVLCIKYHVLCTQGNNNSEIGVAQTVLKQLKGDEDFFVVEMGAYKIGEIKAICDIVHPKIGIITGIGDQHLELFGSLDNIRKAKYELIESLPKNGKKFIAEKDFTLNEARGIKVFKDHVEFSYNRQKFSLNLLGKELIRNVLGIIKVAQYLGLLLAEIGRGLSGKFENVYPKLLGNNIIDNSYNSSLESFLSALEYLKVWKGYKKIVITPGFIELGKNTKSDWEKVLAAAKFVDEFCLNTTPKLPITNKTVILLQGRVSPKIKDFTFARAALAELNYVKSI